MIVEEGEGNQREEEPQPSGSSGSHLSHAHPHALSQNQNQNAIATVGSISTSGLASSVKAAAQHSEAILREAGSPETNVFYEQVRFQKSVLSYPVLLLAAVVAVRASNTLS